MLGLFENHVSIGKQNLISVRESVSGDMNGSRNSTEIYTFNDKVYITYSKAKYWFEDSEVTEYCIDKKALEEIEEIFRKNKMNGWNNKKFTDDFVCDGATCGYSFTFDGGENVSFSSQIYPKKYRDILFKIDDVIKKYTENAIEEPGLVREELPADAQRSKAKPDNNRVEINVFEYSKNRVHIRVLNGTSEDISIENDIKLIRCSDEKILYENKKNYPINVSQNSTYEKSIELENRLDEGLYKLCVSGYCCEFEIVRMEAI